MTANQKCGFLPCRGGPYDGQDLLAGDDVPEGWRITVGWPAGTRIGSPETGWAMVEAGPRGVYVRKGEFLMWEAMK